VGDLSETGTMIRGILIAGEFSPRAVAAARVVPNLRLVRYGFRFSFDVVSPPSAQDDDRVGAGR
jgi:hypothetical protein